MASGQRPEFIRNDQLPPDAPEPLTTMSGAGCWRTIRSSIQNPKSITELKEPLRVIWDSQPHESINKAVKSFTL